MAIMMPFGVFVHTRLGFGGMSLARCQGLRPFLKIFLHFVSTLMLKDSMNIFKTLKKSFGEFYCSLERLIKGITKKTRNSFPKY